MPQTDDVITPPPSGANIDWNNTNFIWVGNSLVAGYLTTYPFIPEKFLTMMEAEGYTGCTVSNNGHSGWQTNEFYDTIDTDIIANLNPAKKNVVIFWEGINDAYWNTGATSASIVANLEDYIDEVKDQCGDLLDYTFVLAMPPRWVLTPIPGGRSALQLSTIIEEAQPILMASTGHWNYVINIHEDSRIWPGDEDTPMATRNADGSHLTDFGNTVIAEIATNKMLALAAPLPKLSTPPLSIQSGNGFIKVFYGASTNATSYQFERSTSATFASDINDLNSLGSSPVNISGLPNGTPQYVRRIAKASGYADSDPAIVSATPAAVVSGTVWLYIVWGQSNVGWRSVYSTSNGDPMNLTHRARYAHAISNAKIYTIRYPSPTWVTMNIGANTAINDYFLDDGFGFATIAAAEVAIANPSQEVYLFQKASGGTTLAHKDDSNDWHPTAPRGNQDLQFHGYAGNDNQLRDALNKIHEAGKTPVLKAVIKYQGESDAAVEAYANQYSDNLEDAFASITYDLQSAWTDHGWGTLPNYKKIINRIQPVFSYNEAVRNGDAAFVDNSANNAILINTDDMTGDGLHLYADSQVALGLRNYAQL